MKFLSSAIKKRIQNVRNSVNVDCIVPQEDQRNFKFSKKDVMFEHQNGELNSVKKYRRSLIDLEKEVWKYAS